MKYLIISLFIVFIGVFKMLSQTDFRPGFIVKYNNDTLYGLIDYKGNSANAKRCVFKSDKNSDIQNFSPEELKLYRFVDSKYYVSKTITTERETKKLFLEYLINGIVDVYYYTDGPKQYYYINKGDSTLYELKEVETMKSSEGRNYIVKKKEYIGILKVLFKDCPEVMKEAENVSLDHKSITKIAKDYHNHTCADQECIVYEKKQINRKFNYGLFFGLNSIKILENSALSDSYDYLKNSNFGNTFFPSFGLLLKFNTPYFNEKVYLQYDVLFSRLKLHTVNSYIEPLYGLNYINTVDLTQSLLKNNLNIRFEFPKGIIRPTFHIGAYIDYVLQSDYNRIFSAVFPSGSEYYNQKLTDCPFKNYYFGLNGGLGFKSVIKDKTELFLDLRYQIGSGLMDGLNSNTISVNLGFSFSK